MARAKRENNEDKKDVMLGILKGSSLRRKYLTARDNDDFPEMGWCGQPNTGKSHAGADFLIRRGTEYPGSVNVVCRDTLKNLRDTTAKLIQQRVGQDFFDSINNEQIRFKFRPEPDPYTGKMVQSTILGFGLDKVDIEDIFRSHEVFSSYIEEGNTVPSIAHDTILWRMRQICFHRSLTVWDLSVKMAARWRVRPEEAYEIMFADDRHSVGRFELTPDAPMPGEVVQKTSWNPTDADELFMRYIGGDYPKPYPTPEWADKNVGVKEVHVDAADLSSYRAVMIAGTEVRILGRPLTERHYVEYHDEKRQLVKLINTPEPIELERLKMIRKRFCQFAFTHENKSRDFNNSLNMFLMEDDGFRKRVARGELGAREGRVFTNYIDEPQSRGGHVVTISPSILKLAKAGIGGIDQGGGHPTAVVHALYLPKIKGFLIYDEYLRSGESAVSTAYTVKEMVLPGLVRFYWGYDPSMDNTLYNMEQQSSYIDSYKPILGEHNLFASPKGDSAYDRVNEYLQIDLRLSGFKPMAKLYVSDTCTESRKALKSLAWKMVKSSNRSNPMIDMGDAIKYMIGVADKTTNELTGVDLDIVRESWQNTRPIFNDRFEGEQDAVPFSLIMG